jgi:hypothetical protein
MYGDSCGDLMEQFAVTSRIRPDIGRPAWHCSLSLPPGERLDDAKWAEIADDFMAMMGFSGSCPYTVVRHSDKGHDHVHIMASRIGFDGRVWKAGRDVYKAIRATGELEARHGLTVTKGLDGRAERKNPSFAERQMETRTGEASPRARLQDLIDDVLATGPTAAEFCEFLEAGGVEVRANLASTGKMNGFSFSVGGIAFKGSSLGKAYGWAGLRGRGLSHEPDRDCAGLERFSARAVATVAGQAKPREAKPAVGPKDGGQTQAKEATPAIGPKDRLKSLIDEAARGRPTAVEFRERLESGGVGVKANLAGTGRLNGFSFTIDGIDFKGSSLWKAYGWGGLRGRGVTYEPGRAGTGLARPTAARVAAEPAAGGAWPDDGGTRAGRAGAEGEPGGVAAGGRGIDSREAGRPGEGQRGGGGAGQGPRKDDGRGEGLSGAGEGPESGDQQAAGGHGQGAGEGGEDDAAAHGGSKGREDALDGEVPDPPGDRDGVGAPDDSGVHADIWKEAIVNVLREEKERRKAKEDERMLEEALEAKRRELGRRRIEEEEMMAAELKMDVGGRQASIGAADNDGKDVHAPGWLTDNFKFWRSPRTHRIYVFPPGNRTEALFLYSPRMLTLLKEDDETVLLVLRAAMEMWPDGVRLRGSETFKAQAIRLIGEHGLDMRLTPDSYPERKREPEQPPTRPRPRGMGM